MKELLTLLEALHIAMGLKILISWYMQTFRMYGIINVTSVTLCSFLCLQWNNSSMNTPVTYKMDFVLLISAFL